MALASDLLSHVPNGVIHYGGEVLGLDMHSEGFCLLTLDMDGIVIIRPEAEE